MYRFITFSLFALLPMTNIAIAQPNSITSKLKKLSLEEKLTGCVLASGLIAAIVTFSQKNLPSPDEVLVGTMLAGLVGFFMGTLLDTYFPEDSDQRIRHLNQNQQWIFKTS